MRRVPSTSLFLCCLGISIQAQHASRFSDLAQVVRTVNPSSGWSRVCRITPGTPIVIRTRDAPSTTVTFVQADEWELTVLAAAALPPKVQRALREASKRSQSLRSVFDDGARIIEGAVEIRRDGIFLADRKVAETGEVVRRIPPREVVAIETPPARRGSVIGAALGAAAGFAVGFRLATYFANRQCNRGCSDEQALMGLSLVGLPVAGGVLGYASESRTTSRVIYAAP
jgi:hypothetical protein